MKTIELIGDIDGQHWLHARVPTEITAAQVRVIVLPHCRERTRLVSSSL
jgi:hypothetical protein